MTISFETAVQDRYARGAAVVAPELCCPVDYDPALLAVIPAEVPERLAADPELWSGCISGALTAIRWAAVIYKGPFREVLDDDGHRLVRGQRTAVCAKTFDRYSREPYAGLFELVAPRLPVDPQSTAPFDCARPALRHPRETKGEDYDATTGASALRCAPDGCC